MSIRCPDCQAINERRRPDAPLVREWWPTKCPYTELHDMAPVPKQGHETATVVAPRQETQRIETIESYLDCRIGTEWTREDAAHVLHHIRQVEATWAAICAQAPAVASTQVGHPQMDPDELRRVRREISDVARRFGSGGA